METLKRFQKRFPSFVLLLYIDIGLPAILYILALLLGSGVSKLFHSYELYIVSTLPNFHSLTGILGILISLYFIVSSWLKKRKLDAALCLVLALLVTAFFLFGLNYELLKPLSFGTILPPQG